MIEFPICGLSICFWRARNLLCICYEGWNSSLPLHMFYFFFTVGFIILFLAWTQYHHAPWKMYFRLPLAMSIGLMRSCIRFHSKWAHPYFSRLIVDWFAILSCLRFASFFCFQKMNIWLSVWNLLELCRFCRYAFNRHFTFEIKMRKLF